MIRQEPLRTQFGVLFGWFERNFSLKTPTVVEKFHPKSWKVHIPGDFCSKSRKIRKIFEKSKSSKNSKSRKVQIPGDLCSKNSKNAKSRKVEKFTFQEISAWKVENSKSRKLFDFLTFCEKFCNFRAVRLPARRALSYDGTPILKRKPVWEDCGNSLLKFTPFWKSIYRKERHIRETKTRTVAHKELSKGNSKKAGNKRGSSVWLGNYTMDNMGICMYLQHLGVETWQPSAQYPTTNPPPKKKHKTHIAANHARKWTCEMCLESSRTNYAHA